MLISRVHYNAENGHFTAVNKSARRNKGEILGNKDSNGHIQITINKKLYLAHRCAWLWFYGEWPEHDIDHINGDRSDNRLINLRKATRSQN
jgi:hypothetical protein